MSDLVVQLRVLIAERDAALQQARRDREYTASQTDEGVKLVNQVITLQADLAALRAERDALALAVFTLTNERDEARARSAGL